MTGYLDISDVMYGVEGNCSAHVSIVEKEHSIDCDILFLVDGSDIVLQAISSQSPRGLSAKGLMSFYSYYDHINHALIDNLPFVKADDIIEILELLKKEDTGVDNVE